MFTVIEGKYRIPRFKFLFSIHHITALSSGTDIKKKKNRFSFFFIIFLQTQAWVSVAVHTTIN